MTDPSTLSDSLFGPRPGARRGPLTLLLDLFSSVRLGIVLMAILFIYCSIGSAGILYPAIGPGNWNPFNPSVWRHDMIRQWRIFELTEFEWFHTAFFNALIALICINITVTTIRRIRLNALTAGVWMIHTGIIILCIGSVLYFGTKFEGDAPVFRRAVAISVPGVPPASLPAIPGNAISVTTPEGEYSFSIASIDPQWELRSEPDIGKRAFAVSVAVQTPRSTFIRQLIADYPNYTEDVIPGQGRVKKLPEFEGRALVDESISLSLEPVVQDSFWLKDTSVLCLREAGADRWMQRTIDGRMPRYNDYLSSLSDVWPYITDEYERPLRPSFLDIPAPAMPGETPATSDVQARITGFLRYAVMRPGFIPGGGGSGNPVVEITLSTQEGQTFDETLIAADPKRRAAFGGRLTFDWITDPAALDNYISAGERRLILRVPEASIEEVVVFQSSELADPDRPMKPLADSGWSYRISRAEDRLPLSSGRSVTLLILDLVNPEGKRISRWVFEDPARNRDNPETAPEEPHITIAPDPRLETVYLPGRTLSPISIVAGPGEIGAHVFFDEAPGVRSRRSLAAGRTTELTFRSPDPSLPPRAIGLRLKRLLPDAVEIFKPAIIPQRQRDRDADSIQAYALIRVELSLGEWRQERWIPFHRYSFDEPEDSLGALSRFEPVPFNLPDGRRIEAIVAREKRPLPNPVRLDDFILTAHVGGFTGRVSSVRDWTSIIRVKDGDSWSEPIRVSTNNPGTHDGIWFFQSFWDPPRQPRFAGDVASSGLNFTGLGVGNRRGVYIQLFGCCLSVAGMIYAFYVKPIIRRRRRLGVLAEIEAGRRSRRPHVPSLDDTPIRDHSFVKGGRA